MSNPITPLTPEQVAAAEAFSAKEGYVKRNLIALDMLGNVLTGGHPDETISSRSSRAAERGSRFGMVMSRFLNLFQKDHGAKAEAGDLERAKTVVVIESSDPAIKVNVVKSVILFALMLLPLSMLGQTAVWTWQNAPQNASLAVCPQTSPVACMAYYELDNVTIPTAPVVISKTISPTAVTYTQTSGISYGNMMVALTLYYYDQTGALQKTASDTASLLVTFSAQPAANLTGKQQ